MWQAFRKKSKEQSSRTLNEKEIQEKLYGQYHKQNHNTHVLEVEPPQQTFSRPTFNHIKIEEKEPEITFPKLVEPPSDKLHSVNASKTPARSTNQRFGKSGEAPQTAGWSHMIQRLSRRNILLIVAFGVCAAFAWQLPWQNLFSHSQPKIDSSNQLSKAATISQQRVVLAPGDVTNAKSLVTVKKTNEGLPVEKQRTVRSEQNQVANLDQGRGKPPQSAIPEIAERVFAIQICTYRQEDGAKNLTQRLKALKLPVYYQGFPAITNETPRFYIVLLGKYETYSEAQGNLTQFKSLPIAKEFSDAYIRRL